MPDCEAIVRFPTAKRWILGTAQWGTRYGVMPGLTDLTPRIAQAMVDEAQQFGIGALDTAPAYGQAERMISEITCSLPIQSKVRGGLGDIRGQVARSLRRCGVERFDSVLVHDWRFLTSPQRVETARALEALESEGRVGRSGPSCYSPDELADALRVFRRLRVAQVPVNVLDQRLDFGGLVDEAVAVGCRIQARSVFLQGLLIGAADLTDRWTHPDLARLLGFGFLDRTRAMGLCLAYVQSRPWVAEIVLGANDTRQLREICRSAQGASGQDPPSRWEGMASEDLDLINPTRWPA